MIETLSHRLATTVIPERYEIRLSPDLASCNFSGEETVFVNVKQAVSEIALNARDLSIHTVSAVDKQGLLLEGKAALDEEDERVIVKFSRQLGPGSWRLHLTFAGTLNPKLQGFYRSSYEVGGQKKILAATQFEATHARQAFPCWDEPSFKAVFQITLEIDGGLTAISNTPIARESFLPGSDKKQVVFQDTIKMSTYLVAFIVGELEATDAAEANGTPLRVWAVPGKSHLGRFAREIGTFSLSFFSRYYGTRYPGAKLDLIAVPDFASGAMENLGAITFRETALLVDERTASRTELERIADVVSHENAHMWFGDLVTMRWWNGLWLNEAFATFMEMMAVDAWKPEWRRWSSFCVSRAAALLVDGLKSTRPVEFPVESPEDAAAMFDVLTYEKGAAVLRMLEQYLGPELFRRGIALYLQKHAYGNAETTDLWHALEESSRQPVRIMMDSWIVQAGYPLITARLDNQSLVLSQQTFRYLSDADAPRGRWQVPVSIRVQTAQGVETRTVCLNDEEARIEFNAPAQWIVVNAGQHGFYRVRYAPELMERLKENLQEKLSAVERFGLINDNWNTTLAGLTTIEDYLTLVKLFRDENDRNVWSAILSSCYYLNRLLDSEQRSAFQAFVKDLVGPAAARLGWQPRNQEEDLARQLRGELLAALGTLGEDAATHLEASNRYARYKSDRSSVDCNLVPALISIVAHCGGRAEYEEFRSNVKKASTPQEEQRYLFSLADFRGADLLRQTLGLTINGEVRSQNAPYLMRALLLNPYGRVEAWSYMKEHWEEMLKQYPDNTIVRMCDGITALATPELEADVNRFFALHPVKQGGKTVEQHLEKLRIAVTCKQRWQGLFRNS